MTRRANDGCETCRRDHRPCDRQQPVCGRCRARGTCCLRSHRFSHKQQRWPPDQTWVEIPEKLAYIEETEDGTYETSEDESDCSNTSRREASTPKRKPGRPPLRADKRRRSYWPPNTSRAPITRINSAREISHHYKSLSNTPSLASEHSPPSSSTPPAKGSYSNGVTGKEGNGSNAGPGAMVIYQPPLSQAVPVWPLQDREEAMLLRHYIDKLAIWLDLCDPLERFQVEVPKRAGFYPFLLNAIFALSAGHLSLTTDYPEHVSKHYHAICLRLIIPVFQGRDTLSDEDHDTLMAASIILRVLEEIDGTMTLNANMTAIKDLSFQRPHSSMRGGLSEAAFWVGLRQEIYFAMMGGSDTELHLKEGLVDRTTTPTTESDWANRAVVHCADVMSFLHKPGSIDVVKWDVMKAAIQEWRDSTQSIFKPSFFRERENGAPFPEVWLMSPCHVIGIQHHALAEILLSLNDPIIHDSDPVSVVEATIKSNEHIRDRLRYLCGIGIHNSGTPPGMFTACMGISLCGHVFTDRNDQEALLDVLVRTEKDHARPTKEVQDAMKKAWGWREESNDLSEGTVLDYF